MHKTKPFKAVKDVISSTCMLCIRQMGKRVTSIFNFPTQLISQSSMLKYSLAALTKCYGCMREPRHSVDTENGVMHGRG